MNAILAHLRFTGTHALQLATLVTVFIGGAWLWLGGALLLLCVLGLDSLGAEYRDTPPRPNSIFLNGALYAVVPLAFLLDAGLLFHTAAARSPIADLAAYIGIGVDGRDSWLAFSGAIFSVGLLGSVTVGAFGHELVHRKTRGEWILGQLLLVHCLHTAFGVQHVYGHHPDVGTLADPATVPRGMSFWRYLPRALAGSRRVAWELEATRLRRRSGGRFSFRNRYLQGEVARRWRYRDGSGEIGVIASVSALAGLSGLAAFVASGAVGILVIEAANYVGHYGLVRVPGTPVLARHAWNLPRLLSTSLTLNLARHSHHHVSAGASYWELRVLEDAPVLPSGLSIMSAAALIPPLWFKTIGPPLEDWDARLASADELAVLQGTIEAGASVRERHWSGAALPAVSGRRHAHQSRIHFVLDIAAQHAVSGRRQPPQPARRWRPTN